MTGLVHSRFHRCLHGAMSQLCSEIRLAQQEMGLACFFRPHASLIRNPPLIFFLAESAPFDTNSKITPLLHRFLS